MIHHPEGKRRKQLLLLRLERNEVANLRMDQVLVVKVVLQSTLTLRRKLKVLPKVRKQNRRRKRMKQVLLHPHKTKQRRSLNASLVIWTQ